MRVNDGLVMTSISGGKFWFLVGQRAIRRGLRRRGGAICTPVKRAASRREPA